MDDRQPAGDSDRPEAPVLELTEAGSPPAPELSQPDPLSRDAARAILDRAAQLMASGDYGDAGVHYRRLVGYDDQAVAAAALLGLGEALYRLDQDDAAIATWESVLELRETPSTYPAWRNVAAARVREGDLPGAIAAYREADRRAPPEHKAEIANRLGWLAKETGNVGASRQYFAKGRGSGPAFPLTWVIIGATVVVSFAALSIDGEPVLRTLELDKPAVAAGEYYRLWSVTLVHGSLLHLLFNMYALYVTGPLVERMYGSRLFGLLYLLCAAAGSVASFVFGPGERAVGASGAVFGLFGILLAASRTHHPVLDRQGRSLVSQVGILILLNLLLGFGVSGIDNAAHVGGLVAGLWLGVLVAPRGVRTLRDLWRGPGGAGAPGGDPAGRTMLAAIAVLALAAVLAAGVVVGTDARRPGRSAVESAVQSPGIAAISRSTASFSRSASSSSSRPSTSSTSARSRWASVLARS